MSQHPADTQALGELERRLSEAKEGSRELDAIICIEHEANLGRKHPIKWTPYPSGVIDGGEGLVVEVPRYTSSVDAALAVVSRTLEPLGFVSWGIDGTQTGYVSAWVAVNKPVGLIQGYAPIQQTTPALAMCLALVRALKVQP
jgi:hypothetical protein